MIIFVPYVYIDLTFVTWLYSKEKLLIWDTFSQPRPRVTVHESFDRMTNTRLIIARCCK